MTLSKKVGTFLSKKDTDMTSGPIVPKLLSFALPLLLGLILQQFYNTVDTVIAGHYIGKEALAAVGSTGSIVNVFVGVCAGLSSGASVVISQRYGAHDDKGLQNAVKTVVTSMLVLSAVTTVVGVLLVDPMLGLMKTPSDVYAEAKEYLTVYVAGISGLLCYNMGAGILRAVGDSVRPLLILFVTAVVNIFVDLLFVIVFEMGVAGTAWATVISQLVSTVIVFAILTKTDKPYGIKWKKLGVEKEALNSMVRIGLPTAIQHGLTSFSNVFVQSHINAFGSDCMAGWTAYNKIDVYVMLPAQSIALSTTTFVGQNWGAKDPRRAREGVKKALWISFIIAAVFAAIVMIFHTPMIRLFNTEPEVIRYGKAFILAISPFCLVNCLNQILAGALRGVGQSRTPTYVMLFSFVVFRQAVLLINSVLGGGFTLVKLAYPLGWVVCSAVLLYFYRRSIIFYPDGVPSAVKRKKRVFVAALGSVFAVLMSGFLLVSSGLYVPTLKHAEKYGVQGVDVSHYQGDIDWPRLKDQDIAFAYIKATEGSSFTDEKFKFNIENALDAGIYAGAYHFFSFESGGAEQAEHFISTVPKDAVLPPAIDVELYETYKAFAPDKETVHKELTVMIDMLTEHYGKTPVIYTTKMTDKALLITEAFECPIWYRDLLGEPEDFTFWQYSSRGELDGYRGDEKYIDLNAFNGSLADLEKLCT